MNRLLTFISGDLKNIKRDPSLSFIMYMPLVLIFIFRFGAPFLARVLLKELEFNLTEYYPFIVSIMLLVPPLMFGMVIGFVILDERDDNILTYISITPLSRQGYLLFRIISAVIYSFIFSFLFVWLINLCEFDFVKFIPIALLVALETPILVLFLGVLAKNKVEGLALSKSFSIMMIAPFVYYFIKSKWQILAGIFPPYWVSRAFLSHTHNLNDYLFSIGIGLLVHILYLLFLLRKFNKVTL